MTANALTTTSRWRTVWGIQIVNGTATASGFQKRCWTELRYWSASVTRTASRSGSQTPKETTSLFGSMSPTKTPFATWSPSRTACGKEWRTLTPSATLWQSLLACVTASQTASQTKTPSRIVTAS